MALDCFRFIRIEFDFLGLLDGPVLHCEPVPLLVLPRLQRAPGADLAQRLAFHHRHQDVPLKLKVSQNHEAIAT